MRALRPWMLAGLAIVLAAGCKRSGDGDRRDVDHSVVVIDQEQKHLRHDRVGAGRFESEATFVLVDAHNTGDRPLMVSLGGDLVDAEGQVVAGLRPESLYVPADGVRTFALIDDENTARPGAVDARVQVTGAHVARHEPTVVIEDGGAYLDQDRVVVNGRIVNTADRRVEVIVIAGFYDAEGMPVRRPFTVREIGGNASQGVQFVGPPGSRKGYIFVGDMVY